MIEQGTIDAKLIEKLRKVLALCDSPSEGEAAAAAAHLARLLEKHNLNIAQLEADGQDAAAIIEHRVPLSTGAPSCWRVFLAMDLAETYFCSVMLGSSGTKRKTSFYFVGRADNVAVANAVYEFLIDELVRLSRESRREHMEVWDEYVNPNQWQASFGLGAAARIGQRLEEERAARRPESQALMVQRDREARDYIDDQYPDLETRSVEATATHAEATREGIMAGDDINLKPLVDDGGGDTKGKLK